MINLEMDDIQSWWEVPSIAHFCSLFRAAFNLLDFDIEELEEALLTDGADDTGSCLLQELMVRLLAGCLGHSANNTDISPFNYQMFLRRLFRQKCQELNRENPFNTDIDFQFLPLRRKVEILYALCDFRLDADDVQEVLKNLESDSLRVEPLGHDENLSAYWYFYGTRLYREDVSKSAKVKSKRKKLKQEKVKKKRGRPSLKQKAAEAKAAEVDEDADSEVEAPEAASTWQAICFTKEDWENLADQFKDSSVKEERALYRTLAEDFLPEIPRLFAEKERLQRKRMMEFAPRRQSSRIEKLKSQKEEEEKVLAREEEERKVKDRKDREKRDRQAQEEMWRDRMMNRQRLGTRASSRSSWSSRSNSCNEEEPEAAGAAAAGAAAAAAAGKPVGRQTNNSLASATGKIVIQSSRQKLRSSQVFKPSKEDIRTGLYKVLEKLKNHRDSWPFLEEVSEEYAPGYYSVISRPMDLNRMGDKLDDGLYTSIDQFRADFMKIVENCKKYNGEDSEYTGMAEILLEVFEESVERYLGSGVSSDEEVAVEFPPEGGRKKRHSQRDVDDDEIEDDEFCDKNTPNDEKDVEAVRSRRGHRTSHRKKRERDRHREEKAGSRTAESDPEFSDERCSDHDDEDTRGSKSQKSKREERSKRTKEPQSSKKKNKKTLEEPDDWEEEERLERKREEQDRVWSQLLEGRPSKEAKKGDEFDFELDDAGWEGLKKGLQEWKREKRGQKESKRENATKMRRMSQEEEDRWFREKEMIHEKLNMDRGGLKESSDSDRNRERSREREDSRKSHKHRTASEDGERVVKKTKANRRDDEDKRSTCSSRKRGNGSRKHGGSTRTVDSQALSLATEQTLKDINKWLDDTPRFCEFSSPSNSPSNTIEDSDQKNSRVDGDNRRPVKGDRSQDPKRRVQPGGSSRSDPSTKSKSGSLSGSGSLSQLALQRRREAQRTTGRLQPGKSKGNLISTIQGSKSDLDTTKVVGKESKISAEWSKSSGPKLSLGTVLTSGFGVGVGLVPRHNFGGSTPESQDSKDGIPDSPVFTIKDDNDSVKLEDSADVTPDVSEPVKPDNDSIADKVMEENEDESKDAKPSQEDVKEEKKSKEKPNPTPNLSAWFKAFGAPKAQPVVRRKPELSATLDVRLSSPSLAATDLTNADLPLSRDFNDDIPSIPPAPRQRRTSTGSSISERSERSFTLDPNDGSSPGYPSPIAYPSPLHRSPDRPPPAYPSPVESSIRVGFYQDTALSKTSPEKNSSPRERPPSPYTQPPPSPYIRPLMSPYAQTPYHPLSYQPYSPAPYSPSPYSPMPYSPATPMMDVNKSVAPRTPAELRHDDERPRSPSPLPPRSPMPARSPVPPPQSPLEPRSPEPSSSLLPLESRAAVDPRSPIERIQKETQSPLHDKSPSHLQIDIRSPHPEQSPDARSPRLHIESRSPMHAGSPMDAESPRLQIDARSPLDGRSPIHSASPIVDSRSPLHAGSPMDSRSPIDTRLQIDMRSPIHSNSPVDSRSPVDNRLQIDSGSPKDSRLQFDTGSPIVHSPSSPADQMLKLKQSQQMGPGTQQQQMVQQPDLIRNQMYPQYHSGAAILPYPEQPPKAPVPQYPGMKNEYGPRGFAYLPTALSNEQSVHNQYKIGSSAAEKALADQYLATMTRASQEPYSNRPYRLPAEPSVRPGAEQDTSQHEQAYSASASNRVPGREDPSLGQQGMQGRQVAPSQEQITSKYAMEQYQSSMAQGAGAAGGDPSVRQFYQMQQQQAKEQQPYHQQYEDSQMQHVAQQQYQQQLEEQKTLPKKKRPTKKQLKQQQEQLELEVQMKQQQQMQQMQQTHQQMQHHQQEMQHEQQRHQLQQQQMQQQGQHQQYNQIQQLQEQRQLHQEAQLQQQQHQIQQQQYQQHLQQQLIQHQSQQVPRSRTPVSSFPVKKRHYAEPVSQSPSPFTPLGNDPNLGKGAFSQPMRSSAPVNAAPVGYPAPAHGGNAGGSGETTQRPQFIQAPSSLGVPRSPFTPVSSGTELSNPRDMFTSAARSELSMSRSPFTPVTSSSESTRSPRGTYPSSDMNPRSPFTPSTVGGPIGLAHGGLGHMMDVYQHSSLYNPNNPLFSRPGSAFRESQQPASATSVASTSAAAAAAAAPPNQGFSPLSNEADKSNLPKQTKGRRKGKLDGSATESSSPTSQTSTAFQQYASKGVLPASAFNFSPSASIPGLYPDKDAFPNYLDEYRAGSAGFYGHSRPTTESTDKNVHNVSNVAPVAGVPAVGVPAVGVPTVQTPSASFPFLGHQTTRPPSYPLAQPFPYDPATYQQYLLHQGLYSSGYHHALGLRQPYDPIQRPHWL